MTEVENLAVNTIRFLSVDAIEKAKSGHPGLPMGAAPMAYTLWSRFLKHSPQNPQWFNRDRFVLSAGHGSMLLYSLLHLFGYDLSLEDIKNFRQWGSKTPGHPEYRQTPGVETTTGPLGQGIANAVGMAVAERRLAAEFNREGYPLVDHYTYCLAGDGCMMEGITYEAASLAGHYKLGKLICLYDDNEITIDGSTHLTFSEDIEQRFNAAGWQVLKVENGNDLEAIAEAIEAAREDLSRPTLIQVKTIIGYGCPQKEGKPETHGAPIGYEEACGAKERLGWPLEPLFYIPEKVKEHFSSLTPALESKRENWEALLASYRKEFPQLAERFDYWISGDIPEELKKELEEMSFDDPLATRGASGQIMQKIYDYLPNFMGGSADLGSSVKTFLKEGGTFLSEEPDGNNIYFGIREHAMGAILSGMFLHGGLHTYGSSFFMFWDYMKPAVRMAALMELGVIYVFSHDSIAVGEDGPTHQPVEQIPNLRSIPNLTVLRPADGKETAYAWWIALNRKEGPTALLLSRQPLPQLKETGEDALKGGYVLQKEKGESPDLIIIATGSEVSLATEAAEELRKNNIDVRVVSMMSVDLFEKQPQEYQEKVLPSHIKKRLVVEAALPQGWEPYATDGGKVIGVDDFGSSAPLKVVMEKYGFTVENVTKQALKMFENKS